MSRHKPSTLMVLQSEWLDLCSLNEKYMVINVFNEHLMNIIMIDSFFSGESDIYQIMIEGRY